MSISLFYIFCGKLVLNECFPENVITYRHSFTFPCPEFCVSTWLVNLFLLERQY